VVTVARLRGESDRGARLTADKFAAAVVEAAGAGGHAPKGPGAVGRLPDGTWVCQFPTSVPASVAPIKLSILQAAWGVAIDVPDPRRVVLKKSASAGLWASFSGKKSGLEVTVSMPPPGQAIGEVTVTGRLFGTPDQVFARTADSAIPEMMADVRRELQNVDDRRRHPRVAADFAVDLYPLHSNGEVDPPLAARCKDVSAGGLAITVETRLRTKYSYVAFDGIAAVDGLAILMKAIRSEPQGCNLVVGAQYRMDL
jgi:hypothetical protein